MEFHKRYGTALLSVIALATLLFGGVSWAAEGAWTGPDQTMVKVKLEKPIVIQETADSEAVIAEVNKKAMEVGLNNMRIHGTNKFTKAETGDVRTVVEWHSISLKSDQDGIVEPLPKSLSSQFRTTDPKAEVGTLLSASGDWDGVLDALESLQEKAANKVTKVEETGGEEDDSPESSFQPATSGGTSYIPEMGSDYDGVGADLTTTTYDMCADFVDEAAQVVKEQKMKTVTGESGEVYETGLCQNTGVTWAIEEITGECEYQWDFENSVAIQMVQWQYTKDNVTQLIGDCRESDVTYPIAEFTDVCDVALDEVNNLAFPQSIFGIDVNGTRFYGTECQPNGTVQWPLYSEYCFEEDGVTKQYQHDFTNHMSYPLEKRYYVKNEGEADEERVYVNNCSVTGTESYVHKYDSTDCGWVMNDETLQAQQLSNTYIETPDGIIEIAGCEARTSPVPYAYTGITTSKNVIGPLWDDDQGKYVEQKWSAPAGVTKIGATLVGYGSSGNSGSGSYLWNNASTKECTSGGMCGLITPAYRPTGGVGGTSGGSQTVNLDIEDGEELPIMIDMTTTSVGGAESSFTTISQPGATGTPGSPPSGVSGGAGGIGYALSNNVYYGKGGKGRSASYSTSLKNEGGDGCCILKTNWTTAGSGTPGAVEFSYQIMKYLRPDGTTYEIPYNGS